MRVVRTVDFSVPPVMNGLVRRLPSTIPSDDAFSMRRKTDGPPIAPASESVLSLSESVTAASPRTSPGMLRV